MLLNTLDLTKHELAFDLERMSKTVSKACFLLFKAFEATDLLHKLLPKTVYKGKTRQLRWFCF